MKGLPGHRRPPAGCRGYLTQTSGPCVNRGREGEEVERRAGRGILPPLPVVFAKALDAALLDHWPHPRTPSRTGQSSGRVVPGVKFPRPSSPRKGRRASPRLACLARLARLAFPDMDTASRVDVIWAQTTEEEDVNTKTFIEKQVEEIRKAVGGRTRHIRPLGRGGQLRLHRPGPPGAREPAQGHLHRRRPDAAGRAPGRPEDLRQARHRSRLSSTSRTSSSPPSRERSIPRRRGRLSATPSTRPSAGKSSRARPSSSSRGPSPPTSSRPKAGSRPSTTSWSRSASIPRRASASRSSSR